MTGIKVLRHDESSFQQHSTEGCFRIWQKADDVIDPTFQEGTTPFNGMFEIVWNLMILYTVSSPNIHSDRLFNGSIPIQDYRKNFGCPFNLLLHEIITMCKNEL